MELELKFPVLMVKFQRPAELMYEFGKKHERVFKRIGDISTLVGVVGMVVATALLMKGAVGVVMGGPAQVGLVVPGVRIPGSPIYIPLVEGLIAVFLLAVFHEGMHGITAAAEGLKAKYAAFIAFLFIPAAGVEIDEKKMKKKGKLTRLRIFSAGSMGNFILALLCFGLLFPAGAVVEKFVDYSGLKVLNSTNLDLHPGDVIVSINGRSTKSVEELRDVLKEIGPGGTVEVKTTNSTVYGRLTGEGKLGVYLQPLVEYRGWTGGLLGFIARVLVISVQLNLGVGIMNLLPLGILDGGRIMAELCEKYHRLASIVVTALLVVNLVGAYLF